MIWDLASGRNERLGQHRIDSHRWRVHGDVPASAQPLGRVIASRRSANRLESPRIRRSSKLKVAQTGRHSRGRYFERRQERRSWCESLFTIERMPGVDRCGIPHSSHCGPTLCWRLRLRTTAEPVPNIYRTVTEQIARRRVSGKAAKRQSRAFSAVAIWQPQVAPQHPFWGGVSPLQSARSAGALHCSPDRDNTRPAAGGRT